MEATTKILGKSPQLFIFPILSVCCYMLWMYVWVFGLCFLMTSVDIILPPRGEITDLAQSKSLDFTGYAYVKVEIAIWFLIGQLWFGEIICSVFKYMTVVCISKWYFTSTHDSKGKNSMLTAIWWTFRYNFGSICFGSFILTYIWIPRIFFEYLEGMIKGLGDTNPVSKCLSCCISCCVSCCHRFILTMNKNAYAQVALSSQNYCTAGREAHLLAMRN